MQVFVVARKGRLTAEFIKSIEECLNLFHVPQLKELVVIYITDLPLSMRATWMETFLGSDAVTDLKQKYQLEDSNFAGVDLNLADNDPPYADSFESFHCPDTVAIEKVIFEAKKRFHKSEIIKTIQEPENAVGTMLESLKALFNF